MGTQSLSNTITSTVSAIFFSAHVDFPEISIPKKMSNQEELDLAQAIRESEAEEASLALKFHEVLFLFSACPILLHFDAGGTTPCCSNAAISSDSTKSSSSRKSSFQSNLFFILLYFVDVFSCRLLSRVLKSEASTILASHRRPKKKKIDCWQKS